jgi:hypothetical protein
MDSAVDVFRKWQVRLLTKEIETRVNNKLSELSGYFGFLLSLIISSVPNNRVHPFTIDAV